MERSIEPAERLTARRAAQSELSSGLRGGPNLRRRMALHAVAPRCAGRTAAPWLITTAGSSLLLISCAGRLSATGPSDTHLLLTAGAVQE